MATTDQIITSATTDITDPRLRKLAMRVVREMELSVEKVVAHRGDAERFPLPQDPTSLERVLHGRVAHLTEAQMTLARTAVQRRLNAPRASREKLLGDLVKVDLTSAEPIAKQVVRQPFPTQLRISKAELEKVFDRHDAVASLVSPAAAPPPAKTMTLRVHRVKCIDETGGGFLGELGMDEISMAATTVDESGDTAKVPEFHVKKFNDGDVKDFVPPKHLTAFSLLEGTAFPKSYFVTIVLAEKDGGGLADFVNQLLKQIRERVISAITAAVGGFVGASGGPIGIAIGVAVGFVVGKVFEFIQQIFADDVFKPVTVSVQMRSLTQRFAGGKNDGPEAVADFRGHNGFYQVTYDWLVA
jgi:hypothetical protein